MLKYLEEIVVKLNFSKNMQLVLRQSIHQYWRSWAPNFLIFVETQKFNQELFAFKARGSQNTR